MPIRAFLYSRRAAEGSSRQAQWPSAILLIDNDPDKDTPPISQTSNKVKHSLSSFNNISAAGGVMDGATGVLNAKSVCVCGGGGGSAGGWTKLPADRKWREASRLSIWCLSAGKAAAAAFFRPHPASAQRPGGGGGSGGAGRAVWVQKHFSNNQSFGRARLLGRRGCSLHTPAPCLCR